MQAAFTGRFIGRVLPDKPTIDGVLVAVLAIAVRSWFLTAFPPGPLVERLTETARVTAQAGD